VVLVDSHDPDDAFMQGDVIRVKEFKSGWRITVQLAPGSSAILPASDLILIRKVKADN
jgi:hypothetical protein